MCRVEGCETALVAKGLCMKHYQRLRRHGTLTIHRIDGPVANRLKAYLERNGPIPEYRPDLGPCWIWRGSLSSQGYGLVSIDGKGHSVHRLVWKLTYGVLPSLPMTLDHLCRVRSCANPAHLEAVPIEENIRRIPRAHRVTCINGHDRTGDNEVYYGARHRRQCRECLRANARRHRQHAKAAAR